MCRTCGCSDETQATLTNLASGARELLPSAGEELPGEFRNGSYRHEQEVHLRGELSASDRDASRMHEHGHAHVHDHPHVHEHGHGSRHSHSHAAVTAADPAGKVIRLEQELLAKNGMIAERNHGWLAGRDIVALNLISSPGAGKTTLLERTIRDLSDRLTTSVIEGDQATLRDAERIQATGCKVVQINTGAGCHLDANMTARGLEQLDPSLHSLVMIENVGNLVCPALFDLGERAKIVIMSVTDGEDKPLKYPHAFRASEVMILNKIDLLPYVSFDVDSCLEFARHVNPQLRVFQISATRGDGLDEWYHWLQALCS